MYQRVEQAEPQVLEHNHGLMVAKEMQSRFPNREDGTQGYYEWDIVVYIDLTTGVVKTSHHATFDEATNPATCGATPVRYGFGV